MSEQVTEKTSTHTDSLRNGRIALAATYFAFVTYAFGFAPGSFLESEQTAGIFSRHFEEVNMIFFAIFNLLGAMGLNLATLLNAGASRQLKILPTEFFTAAGTFLGFAAIGPYLILRKYAPKVNWKEVRSRSVISRVLESRVFAISVSLFCAWAYAYGFGVFVDTAGDGALKDLIFVSSFAELARLVQIDRVVSVSCVDVLALSVATWGPLTEDMKRRGWFTEKRYGESLATALLILSTPGLGVALYSALRPTSTELEKEQQRK